MAKLKDLLTDKHTGVHNIFLRHFFEEQESLNLDISDAGIEKVSFRIALFNQTTAKVFDDLKSYQQAVKVLLSIGDDQANAIVAKITEDANLVNINRVAVLCHIQSSALRNQLMNYAADNPGFPNSLAVEQIHSLNDSLESCISEKQDNFNVSDLSEVLSEKFEGIDTSRLELVDVVTEYKNMLIGLRHFNDLMSEFSSTGLGKWFLDHPWERNAAIKNLSQIEPDAWGEFKADLWTELDNCVRCDDMLQAINKILMGKVVGQPIEMQQMPQDIVFEVLSLVGYKKFFADNIGGIAEANTQDEMAKIFADRKVYLLQKIIFGEELQKDSVDELRIQARLRILETVLPTYARVVGKELLSKKLHEQTKVEQTRWLTVIIEQLANTNTKEDTGCSLENDLQFQQMRAEARLNVLISVLPAYVEWLSTKANKKLMVILGSWSGDEWQTKYKKLVNGLASASDDETASVIGQLFGVAKVELSKKQAECIRTDARLAQLSEDLPALAELLKQLLPNDDQMDELGKISAADWQVHKAKIYQAGMNGDKDEIQNALREFITATFGKQFGQGEPAQITASSIPTKKLKEKEKVRDDDESEDISKSPSSASNQSQHGVAIANELLTTITREARLWELRQLLPSLLKQWQRENNLEQHINGFSEDTADQWHEEKKRLIADALFQTIDKPLLAEARLADLNMPAFTQWLKDTGAYQRVVSTLSDMTSDSWSANKTAMAHGDLSNLSALMEAFDIPEFNLTLKGTAKDSLFAQMLGQRRLFDLSLSALNNLVVTHPRRQEIEQAIGLISKATWDETAVLVINILAQLKDSERVDDIVAGLLQACDVPDSVGIKVNSRQANAIISAARLSEISHKYLIEQFEPQQAVKDKNQLHQTDNLLTPELVESPQLSLKGRELNVKDYREALSAIAPMLSQWLSSDGVQQCDQEAIALLADNKTKEKITKHLRLLYGQLAYCFKARNAKDEDVEVIFAKKILIRSVKQNSNAILHSDPEAALPEDVLKKIVADAFVQKYLSTRAPALMKILIDSNLWDQICFNLSNCGSAQDATQLLENVVRACAELAVDATSADFINALKAISPSGKMFLNRDIKALTTFGARQLPIAKVRAECFLARCVWRYMPTLYQELLKWPNALQRLQQFFEANGPEQTEQLIKSYTIVSAQKGAQHMRLERAQKKAGSLPPIFDRSLGSYASVMTLGEIHNDTANLELQKPPFKDFVLLSESERLSDAATKSILLEAQRWFAQDAMLKPNAVAKNSSSTTFLPWFFSSPKPSKAEQYFTKALRREFVETSTKESLASRLQEWEICDRELKKKLIARANEQFTHLNKGFDFVDKVMPDLQEALNLWSIRLDAIREKQESCEQAIQQLIAQENMVDKKGRDDLEKDLTEINKLLRQATVEYARRIGEVENTLSQLTAEKSKIDTLDKQRQSEVMDDASIEYLNTETNDNSLDISKARSILAQAKRGPDENDWFEIAKQQLEPGSRLLMRNML